MPVVAAALPAPTAPASPDRAARRQVQTGAHHDDDRTGTAVLVAGVVLGGAALALLLLRKKGTVPPGGCPVQPSSLVKGTSTAGVYVVMGDCTVRPMPNIGAMELCSYAWDQIQTIPDATLAQLSEGPPVLGPPWSDCPAAPLIAPFQGRCPWNDGGQGPTPWNNVLLQSNDSGYSYLVSTDCHRYLVSSPADMAFCHYDPADTLGTQDETLIGSIPYAGLIAPTADPKYACQPFRVGL